MATRCNIFHAHAIQQVALHVHEKVAPLVEIKK